VIEARCQKHLHFRFDPDAGEVHIKCRWCSHEHKRDVFHVWTLNAIIEQVRAGHITGVCSPNSPQWVRWVIK